MTRQCSVSKRRGIPPAAWDAIRPRFTTLYLVERRTLPQIMSILAEEGFPGTIKQFKDRIRKWNLHKNVKASLKDQVLDQILASTTLGLPHAASYSIGDVSIPAHKLLRHAKAKNTKSTTPIPMTRGSGGTQLTRADYDISSSIWTQFATPPTEDRPSAPSQTGHQLTFPLELIRLKRDLIEVVCEIMNLSSSLSMARLLFEFYSCCLDGSFPHIDRSRIRGSIKNFASVGKTYLLEELATTTKRVACISAGIARTDRITHGDLTIRGDPEAVKDLHNFIDYDLDDNVDRVIRCASTYNPIGVRSLIATCYDTSSIEAEFNRLSHCIEAVVSDIMRMSSNYEYGSSSSALEALTKRVPPAAVLHDVYEVDCSFKSGDGLEDVFGARWYILPLYASLPPVTCNTDEPDNRYSADPVLFDAGYDETYYLDTPVSFVSADFQGLASRLALRPLLRSAAPDADFVIARSPSPPSLQSGFLMDFSW